MQLAEYDRLPSRRVAVEGGEMWTVDAGEGPPVVLVHGNPTSSLEFRGTIDRLRTGFRVIAPDLLTFGRSSGPKEGAGFALQVRAMRELLDALELESFHLVVHDWGGAIGLGAAVRRPEQVERLVLLNTSFRSGLHPPPYWWPAVVPGLGELLLVSANLFSRGLPLMMRALRRDPQLRARYRAPLEDVATRRTILRLERLDGYAEECRRVERALPQLRGPKMILWGHPDAYFLGEHRRMRRLVPDARFVSLPGAGHFGPEDAPERVADAVHGFLAEG